MMATASVLKEERASYLRFRTIVDSWSKLGEKTYEDGTRWIGHVPHRAPEAYLHQLFAPLDKGGLEELQRQIGQEFPDSLRRFLSIHNGVGTFTNYVNVYGLRRHWSRTDFGAAATQPFSMVEDNVDSRHRDLPDDMIIIGSVGDEVERVAVLPNGEITNWQAQQNGQAPNTYPNIFEFLLAETQKASTLFDSLGRRWDGSDILQTR